MSARKPRNIKTIATNTTAATVFAAQGDAAATGNRGDVKAVKKVTKYAELLGDTDDRRICRATRLTGCTTRLNVSTTRRNKHGGLCFVVTVEGRRDSDVRRFKRLLGDKFPDIFSLGLNTFFIFFFIGSAPNPAACTDRHYGTAGVQAEIRQYHHLIHLTTIRECKVADATFNKSIASTPSCSCPLS
nr:hypothetical protein HmN_000222300 [Hymenolepis microstoma]